MNLASQWALGTYYYGTLPWRMATGAVRARRGTAPVMILFYHRVADTYPNAWTISRRRFARQITWLQRHFDLVDLAEAQRQIASGENHRPSVSITFDDGYAENSDFALPLLVANQVPCTYFVASHHVLAQRPFAHDVAAGRPLPVHKPEALRQWSAAGIEIGAHTRTHADLGPIDDLGQLDDEIAGSRRELAQLIDRPVRYFAFPYGQPEIITAAAIEIARQAGFEAIASASGGYNFPGDDPFYLQRIHADPELVRLKNWLSVDLRKVRRHLL